MWDRVKRKLMGVAHPEATYRKCAEGINNAIQNLRDIEFEDPFRLLEDESLRNDLLNQLRSSCYNCLQTRGAKEQKLNIRREIMKAADLLEMFRQASKFSPDDREILRRRTFSYCPTFEDFDMELARKKTLYSLYIGTFRAITSKYHKDMRPGDWFQAYECASAYVWEARHQATIDHERSGSYSHPLALAMRMYESKLAEIETIAAAGGSYDVDQELGLEKDHLLHRVPRGARNGHCCILCLG